MTVRQLLKFAVFGAMLAGNSFAVTLFEQDFDSATPGLNASLDGWFIYRPAIDVVEDNSYDIRCLNETGNCVDLDGTYMQGTYMWTQATFTFQQGYLYTLSFWLSGNQRDMSQTDTLIVRVGSEEREFNLAASDPWALQTISFIGDGSTGKIIFDQRGNPNPFVGDNVGILLDSILFEEETQYGDFEAGAAAPVPNPEPGTIALLASGLGLLAWRRRRNS